MRSTPRRLLGSAVALSAPFLFACGSASQPPALEPASAPHGAGYRVFWVGARFEGLPLTGVSTRYGATSLVYGTCTPVSTGDGASCTPPLTIQATSICDRNALELDIRPHAWLRRRGTIVFQYEDRRLELASAGTQIVVFARPARARRAIDALRPVGGPDRAGVPLPPPRYPRAYVAELRRVRKAVAETHSIRAARTRLHISQSAVRFELALARDPQATRGGTSRCTGDPPGTVASGPPRRR